VSGILLSKTFGQQGAAVQRFVGLNRKLALLQIRQAMVGRWFFMIVGTVFSITPGLVYWLAGWLRSAATRPRAHDRRHRHLHHLKNIFFRSAKCSMCGSSCGAAALFDRIFEYMTSQPRSRCLA
jgi:ATP-binding cassette subfamily B protein